jgi:hypothetical protein
MFRPTNALEATKRAIRIDGWAEVAENRETGVFANISGEAWLFRANLPLVTY